MPLTHEQLARIDFLLYGCEDDPTFAQTLRRIDSSAELHALTQQINWDDGFVRLNEILDHPLCDRGTALMIYWLGDPTYLDATASDQVVSKGNQQIHVFLKRVETQLMSYYFKHNTIAYDPMVDLNAVQRRMIAAL